MRQDLDSTLRNWEFKPGSIQARMVEGGDGRQVIQMRLDLGILQMEKLGRPDGTRPHGQVTYLDYLKAKVQSAASGGLHFTMSPEDCQEVDREFSQFYHRRICWLALQNYARAIADADHTLAMMDMVRDHSPSEDYTVAHEFYRTFVLYHRIQALAAFQLEKENPEGAIDEIHVGLKQIEDFLTERFPEEEFQENQMVQQLERIATTIREEHGIGSTLQEKLAEAVANEQYEEAARLRDALRRKN